MTSQIVEELNCRGSGIIVVIIIIMNNNRNSFYKVNLSFLGTDVPRAPAYGIYLSQLIRFSRDCSFVGDLNSRNLI